MRALPVLCFLLLVLPASAQDLDLLIRGGRIVDGTGNPSFLGDIGIRSDRIEAMGRLGNATAKRTIDATGLTVAPGFIDIHNHSDYTLVADGNAQSMIRQGVTSMILGEGGSAAPIGGKQALRERRVLPQDAPADWSDFGGYFARLLRQGISTNVGSYVGSSQIWTYVRGERAGPPTSAELDEMRALVRQAMEQGALGVASSLSGPPGSWIDTDTLVAMCQAAAPLRRQLLDAHAHRRTGRFRIGGGSHRDRPPRPRAGGHHPPEDRRAHHVGPDAGAGGHYRAAPAQKARKCRPMSILTAPGRTIWPPSFRPGRTKEARRLSSSG